MLFGAISFLVRFSCVGDFWLFRSCKKSESYVYYFLSFKSLFYHIRISSIELDLLRDCFSFYHLNLHELWNLSLDKYLICLIEEEFHIVEGIIILLPSSTIWNFVDGGIYLLVEWDKSLFCLWLKESITLLRALLSFQFWYANWVLVFVFSPLIFSFYNSQRRIEKDKMEWKGYGVGSYSFILSKFRKQMLIR